MGLQPPLRSHQAGNVELTRVRGGWLTSFLLLLATVWTWSLASPLFSSPDEPSHMVKAAAVARGQLGSEEVFDSNGVKTYAVKVPGVFARAPIIPQCFAFNPTVTPACSPPFRGGQEKRLVITAAGRYPPLYYLVVGLPSLAFPSSTGVYLARFVSGAISAALLAWALRTASSWKASRLPVLGVALAVTPMVVYLAGSVNPNGVEISAAVALWVALLVIVLGGDEPAPGVLVQAAVSASVLVMMRGLSPLWLGLIGLFAMTLGRRAHLRTLLARPEVQRWLAVAALSTILALAWILLVGVLEQPAADTGSTTLAGMIRTSISRGENNLRQMVGLMGWADAPPPALTYFLWFFGLGFLVVTAAVVARRRVLVNLFLLLVTIVVLPVALEVSQARDHGYVWQGRYTLPLGVGLPILAAFATSSRTSILEALLPRLATVLCAMIGIAHVAAFSWALHRFTVGAMGPLVFFQTHWSPPVPAWLLLFAFVAATVGLARWYRHLAAEPGAA